MTPRFDTDLAGADDETLAAVVAQAEVPPLLVALASALDDPTLIPEHLQPDHTVLLDPNAGLSPDQIQEARDLALDALHRLQDKGAEPVSPLPPDQLEPLLGYLAGGEEVHSYLELLREELALGEDRRAPSWRLDEIAPGRSFRVAVIGAGMSGLLAAHRLHQAGVEVVVLEKNPEVGGTWYENSYPGCRVDINNHFYSYSFATQDWPEHFSSQPVLLDYFRRVAEENGVRPLIRFGTEVTRVELDERTMTWTLTVEGPDGPDRIEANAVVSAVGQLNRPNIPDIPGADTFEGPTFHSARWDHDLNLDGKRVAVIGTGASAAQFIPIVAEEAAHLTILQRTPAWFIPTEDYHDAVSPEVHWLNRNVPGYQNWFRFWIFFRLVEGLLPAARVDPEWDGGGQSVSEINDLARVMLAGYLQLELADRPDLLEKVVPTYPPFAKRFIRDNGAWIRTIKRADVDLVTESIEAITPTGIRTKDGVDHPVDVIIYGTGFTASDFLMPMEVVGRDGVELHERWQGDARAHLGVTLPGFPNLFLLYGPNTNIVVNGSITFFSECEVHHVLDLIEVLLRGTDDAVEPTQAAHDAFNERIDAENARMAWGVSSVNSWYKNRTGRVAQNWPFTLLEYWEQTRTPEPADYALHRR